MTHPTAPPSEKPAHYRLSTATWEIILKEYREGATAPFLSRKWRVSEHAIRKRATQHGATKRDWGDAQAIGQALAREAELEEARRNSPEAVASRLFDGIGEVTPEESLDPSFLAKVAVIASGRAMQGRLWNEAKSLAGLAESYVRLDQKAVNGPPTVERMDLHDLLDIVTLKAPGLFGRFRVDPDSRDDPDDEIKAQFWRWHYEMRKARDAAAISAAAEPPSPPPQ